MEVEGLKPEESVTVENNQEENEAAEGNAEADETEKEELLAPLEGSFKDAKERDIKTFSWMPPEEQPKALLFLCHGYGERLTPYYSSLASKAASEGILAFGHDHTGHGLSGGERVQVSSIHEYTGPVLSHCREKVSQYPGVPLFLLGHSMGGLIALLSLLESKDSGEADLFRGLLLMGPLIQLDPKVAGPWLQRLARVMSKLFPNFAMSGVDTDKVTSCEHWRKVKKEDKLHNHGGLKARHGTVLMDSLQELQKRLPDVSIPYLILHGAEDEICNPEGSRQLHSTSTSEDKTLKIIEKGLHNLYLEVEAISTEAFRNTLDWIKERT